MNKADPAGLTAPVEASAIYSSMRIVSNDVTLTPVQSGKKKKKKNTQLPTQRGTVRLGSINEFNACSLIWGRGVGGETRT